MNSMGSQKGLQEVVIPSRPLSLSNSISKAIASAISTAISALITGVSSVAGKTGDVTLSKSDVGLGNVDNTSDSAKPISSATQAALDGKQAAGSYATAAQGAKADSALQPGSAISTISGLQTALDGKQPSGNYATLVGGAVPAYQLPSYVDDVLEFATTSAFPATGETSKIYVSTGTNKTYRWSGSAYVEIASSPGSTDSVTEGSTNLYFTAARAISALASTLSGYATNSALTAAISGLSSIYQTASQVSSSISSAIAGFISDAPVDGSQYARKDAAWEAIQTGNPFDQSLNSNDDVRFNTLALDPFNTGSTGYIPGMGIGSPPLPTGTITATGVLINSQSAVTTDDSRLSDARTPTAHNHPLSDLTQSSATSGQVPSWNGTAWVPTTPSGGGGNPFDQSLNTTDDVSFNSAVITSQLYSLGNLRVATTDAGDDTFVLGRTQGDNMNGTACRIDHFWNNPTSGVPKALVVNVTGQAASGDATLLEATFGGSRKFAINKDGTMISGSVPDARLSSNVALKNVNNSFTAGQSITASANTSALTATYSVTGANTTPLLDLSGTWNTTGVARGILLNITETASAATSKLLDVQSSGTSAFSVNKFGTTSGTGGFSFTPAANTGTFSFVSGSTGSVQFNSSSGNIFTCRADSIKTFNFGSSFAVGWNGDTTLFRDAASTLALRNGGTAAIPAPQTFRIYNYTDSGLTNYERGFMRWNSNTLEIGTEAGGTGTGRILALLSAGGNVSIAPASGSTCIVQSAASPSLSIGIGGEAIARARLQTDAVAFGAGGSSARDLFLMRNSSTVFEVNNGTAGTLRDLRLRNIIQRSGIGTTVTPATNGDLVIEQTSDTSITIKMKGTDGTVRTASLILT